MTGAELLAYVKRTFKRDDKDTELYEAISDAVREIQRKRAQDANSNYSDLSLTDGDWRVAVGSDFEYVTGDAIIIDTNNNDDSYAMRKISKEEYDALEPYPDATDVDKDQPWEWAYFGGYIWVYPVSDGTYTVRVNHTEATDDYAVAAGTDPVPFSARHRRMLKAYVLKFMYAELGLDNEAAKWASLADAQYDIFFNVDYNNTNAVEGGDFHDI